jgi:hypothetical protein
MSEEEEDNPNILTRLAARESSTLGFAAVAASSSLIVLALTMQSKTSWWLQDIGLLFAFLGILYREVTFFSSDLAEFEMLSKRVQNRLHNATNTKLQDSAKTLRRVTVRLFLWLPVMAWLILMGQIEAFPLAVGLLFLFFLVLSIVVTAVQFWVEALRRERAKSA